MQGKTGHIQDIRRLPPTTFHIDYTNNYMPDLMEVRHTMGQDYLFRLPTAHAPPAQRPRRAAPKSTL
jgi:hypothetical protein